MGRLSGHYRRQARSVRLPHQLRAVDARGRSRRGHLGAAVMEGVPILSLMLLVPLVAGLACFFLEAPAARVVALAATLIDLALGIALWASYDIGGAQWQFTERAPLFAGFSYALGIDGIALLLIVLSVFLMPICILASWTSIDKRVGEYMAAFLFMELLMIGVFAAQDILLFY